MQVPASSVTVTSTMSEDTIVMGIATADMGWVMTQLTKLYSNPLQALIRETATNAADSHKEAGVSLPIEVTLPSVLDPTLKIQDYGVGLDREAIETIYSQYGASTKRDSNDQNGMFGFGSKSPLAYTPQFMVTSVKDGRKLQILVGLDEQDRGYMSPMGPKEGIKTDDANGVTVSVQVRKDDISRTRTLVEELFQYWDKGTVLVNGEEPQHFTERYDTEQIADDIWIARQKEDVYLTPADVVVMGGVPYPQSLKHGVRFNGRGKGHFATVAFIPNGTAKPTPSRESLEHSDLTKRTLFGVFTDAGDTIDGYRQKFEKGFRKIAQDSVSQAASGPEALAAAHKWGEYSWPDRDAFTWNGEAIPERWEPQAEIPGKYGTRLVVETTNASTWDKPATLTTYSSVTSEYWHKRLWVTGFDVSKVTSQHKEKINLLLEANPSGPKLSEFDKVVWLRTGNKPPEAKWMDQKNVISFADVKAVKVERNVSYGGGRKVAGTYDAVDETNSLTTTVDADLLNRGKDVPIFWTTAITGHYWRALHATYGTFTLVELTTNRVDKFKRLFPQAQEAVSALREPAKAWFAGLSEMDKIDLYFLNTSYARRQYAGLDPYKVDDPDVKLAIRRAKHVDNKPSDVMALQAKYAPIAYYVPDFPEVDPLESYPLASFSYHPEESYEYVNSVYAARKGRKGAK